MAYSKVGFHIAANCGGCTGIAEYWAELDAAGIPFTVYSANEAGVITQAAQYQQATLIYRDVEKLKTFYPRSGFVNGFQFQGCTRFAVKLDFLAGIVAKAFEASKKKLRP